MDIKPQTTKDPLALEWEVSGTLGSDSGPYYVVCMGVDAPVIMAKDLAHSMAYHIVKLHNASLI